MFPVVSCIIMSYECNSCVNVEDVEEEKQAVFS